MILLDCNSLRELYFEELLPMERMPMGMAW
jgi:hypothetical protein